MQWKQIEGFPQYQISDTGLVKTKNGNIMKTSIAVNGYEVAHLRANGRTHSFGVHRLVCKHFCAPPKTSKHNDAAHKDGNRRNNHAENLYWATRQENMADARRHGTIQGKLSEADVLAIRASPDTPKKLATKYGVSAAMIYRIHAGVVWQHIDTRCNATRTRQRNRGRKPKLRASQVRDIRESTLTARALAVQYGVTEETISNARRGLGAYANIPR